MADQAQQRPRRVDVGFSGGQVLALRMAEEAYTALREALEGRDDGSTWHEFETMDSQVTVDLRQVVYVRLDTEHQRVGF